MDYELIDSGNQKKLEKFGDYILERPCSQAVWLPTMPEWKKDAIFSRDEGNHWTYEKKLPKSWNMTINQMKFIVSPSEFGHVGVFPEHATIWTWMSKKIQNVPEAKILNLFGYTGGATAFLANKKAKVCHVDASSPMIERAKENMALNHLEKAPVRWIVDDVTKFLKREVKRNNFYHGILLDPPSFGRGTQGEVFKIENDIIPLLQLCASCLEKNPLFIIFSCHTPGFTNLVIEHLLKQTMPNGQIQVSELTIDSKKSVSLPSGVWGLWQP
jgi:23S rRNA (cytosine1962-C5)-methyltransferase